MDMTTESSGIFRPDASRSTAVETPRAIRERLSASAAREARDCARAEALQHALLAYSAGAGRDEREVLCVAPSELIKA